MTDLPVSEVSRRDVPSQHCESLTRPELNGGTGLGYGGQVGKVHGARQLGVTARLSGRIFVKFLGISI